MVPQAVLGLVGPPKVLVNAQGELGPVDWFLGGLIDLAPPLPTELVGVGQRVVDGERARLALVGSGIGQGLAVHRGGRYQEDCGGVAERADQHEPLCYY